MSQKVQSLCSGVQWSLLLVTIGAPPKEDTDLCRCCIEAWRGHFCVNCVVAEPACLLRWSVGGLGLCGAVWCGVVGGEWGDVAAFRLSFLQQVAGRGLR